MSNTSTETPEVIAPPPLIFGAALVVSQVIQLVRRTSLLPDALTPLRRLTGGGLIAGGFAIGLWGFRTMARAGTSVDPGEPSTALVEDGPFQYSRNPLYLTLVAIYVGITLLRNNPWGILLLPGVLTAIRFGVIEREEMYLQKRFGNDYRAYTERVPRWL